MESRAHGYAPGGDGDAAGGAVGRCLLRCDMRVLFAMVSSLYQVRRKQQSCIVSVTHRGLSLYIDNVARSLHGVAYMAQDQFTHFDLVGVATGEDADGGDGGGRAAAAGCEALNWRVNLGHFLECLSLYGKDALATTSVTLTYSQEDA
jgi:hypothetical protein